MTGVDVEHKVVDLVPARAASRLSSRELGFLFMIRCGPRCSMCIRKARYRRISMQRRRILSEGRANFARLRLSERRLLESGSDTYMFLWAGDRIVNTVVAVLAATELRPTPDGLAISVAGVTPVELAAQIMAIVVGEQPDAIDLALTVANKAVEKYDGLIPEPLLSVAYAARNLDIPGAWRALQEVVDSTTGERQ